MLEALFAQPCGHGHGPHAMMADGDDAGVGIKLLIGAGRDLAHRHEDASVDLCFLKLPFLSYIEQNTGGMALGEQLPELMCRNLIVQHRI